MKTTHITSLRLSLLTALAISAAGALSAQPPETGPPPARERSPVDRPHPLLMMFDADRDGVITADEIAAVTTRVQGLDTNGDGVVSRDELPGPPPRGDGGRRGGPPADRDS